MAAKQSKLWAYIIIALIVPFIGIMIYYFGWLKPDFEKQIETAEANADYFCALYDSCVNAKTYTDTVIYESVVYDTVTVTNFIESVAKKGDIGDKNTGDKPLKKGFNASFSDLKEYSSTYETADFSLPMKIMAADLESITFLPYTIRNSQITNSTVIDCPPCPEIQESPKRQLYFSLFAGYGGAAITGANLTYIGKKNIGANIGYATTFDKHFGTVGLTIKLK